MDNKFIDLGLPSGTLWAQLNFGVIDCMKKAWEEYCVEKKEEVKKALASGVFQVEEPVSWEEYIEGMSDDWWEAFTGYNCRKSSVGKIPAEDGNLPTREQFEELVKFTTQSKMCPSCCVVRFTGKNGNSIVLPSHETAACYYIDGSKEVLYVHHDGVCKFLEERYAFKRGEKKLYCVRLVK